MSITILLLCSCASLDYRTKQNDLKNELIKKNYAGAINIINKKDFILQEEEVSEIKWYDINMVIKMMENNDDSIINSPRILKLLKILNNKKYVRDALE